MKARILIPVIAVVLCLVYAGNVIGQEAERILSFRSDISVHQDASMTVTETIKVLATGDKIRHGIDRDFPTIYKDSSGNQYIVGFQVTTVTRDGAPEPYTVESISNGERVRIGSANTAVEPGNHTYSITYNTTRQLGFFKDHDELYWNATGNDSVFPIDKAIAVVTLPKPVTPSQLKLKAYTGPEGSKGQDYDAYVDSGGHAIFTTTRPLGPKEGLTIVVGWPKGMVTEPTQAQKNASFLRDNLNVIFGVFGLILVLVYYIYAWNKVGRDPRRGTIIPIYEPPDGLSPAALRFICKMGYDNKGFAAALIDMGVKRYARITEEKGVYTISQYKTDASTLTPEEQALADKLLGDGGTIELKDKNYTTIQSAIKAIKDCLEKAYGTGYFSRNGIYLIPGITLSALTVIAGAMSMPAQQMMVLSLVGSMVVGVWAVGLIALIAASARAWRRTAAGGGAMSCLGAGCASAMILPLIAAGIAAIVVFGKEASPVMMGVSLIFALVNYIFALLLRAPTQKGRALLDKIEGFKLYMSVAEKDEINTMNPPEKTPEIFEKYLPYALALDVEQKWAEKFAAVIEAAAAAGAYEPDWYSGRAFSRGFTAGALTSFTSSIGNSLSGSISSSSTAPGSSSGFSSGGSSGGGGGGGGVGGW